MTTSLTITAIAVGAAIGGYVRYSLGEFAVRRWGVKYPGTFAANMLACFVAGIGWTCWNAISGQLASGADAQGAVQSYGLVVVGLAGATSTWSTLASEIVTLWEHKSHWAVLYPLLTIFIGALCLISGLNLPHYGG